MNRAGASFCLNRLMRPIVRGTKMNGLLLQPVIVDVIADDNRRYVHGQADKYVKHTLTPPSVVD